MVSFSCWIDTHLHSFSLSTLQYLWSASFCSRLFEFQELEIMIYLASYGGEYLTAMANWMCSYCASLRRTPLNKQLRARRVAASCQQMLCAFICSSHRNRNRTTTDIYAIRASDKSISPGFNWFMPLELSTRLSLVCTETAFLGFTDLI